MFSFRSAKAVSVGACCEKKVPSDFGAQGFQGDASEVAVGADLHGSKGQAVFWNANTG